MNHSLRLSSTKGFLQVQTLNIDKLLAAIACVFIALALIIIASTPPATGYELSIYDAYPLYFWFLLIAAIGCGIGILLHQAFAEKKSRWWLAGLAAIILANSIFLLLPEFRGYFFVGRGDTPSHLGYIKDVLNTGHIGKSNFYPIEHILSTSLVRVAGVSLENIPSLFFVLFSGVYIVNMYLLARSASNRSGYSLLAIAFASPLIYSFFHANIHPSMLSLFMVPLLLYFYHRREQLSYGKFQNTVLVFLLAFCITFFHPITTLFAIAIFLAFGLGHALYSRLLSHNTPQIGQNGIAGKSFLGISIVMFIAFFTWYFSYSCIQRSFKQVYDWVVYQIGTPLVEVQLELLAYAELTPLQTFELFVNRYGAISLLLLISGIAFISVLRRSLSRKHNLEPMNFIYAIQFVVALFIGATMLFGYFAEYNPVRVARFPLLMGTVLSGLVVYDFIAGNPQNPNKGGVSAQRLGLMIAIGLVIMAMVTLGMGSVYRSPRVCGSNHQVTQMDIVGTEWFGRSKSPDTPVIAYSSGLIRRFEDYNFGAESSPIPRARVAPERLPSHFGYDEHNQVAEALGFQDRYMVIFGLDKMWPMFFPENVRPKICQWTEEDFAKLRADSSAAQIYANGEFEVWRVYGKEQK